MPADICYNSGGIYHERLYLLLNSNLVQLLSYLPSTLGCLARSKSERHSLGWTQVKRRQ